ncbi:MAG: hypothetical protein ABIB61_01650 [Candidatus Shapirobacteria bacterium]
MKYLNSEQYYVNLYDLFTIKACLKIVKFWQDLYKKKDADPKLKKIPPEEVEKGFNHYLNRELMIKKGEEYRRKSETISEWIEKDRVRQDKIDNTPPPKILCPKCKIEMTAEDFKHLEDWPEDKPMKVHFIFECPKCKKRLGADENGKIRKNKPSPCLKCGKDLKTTYKRKGQVITTTTKCTGCKYKNVEVKDLNKEDARRKAEEKADKELLEKYRKKFCLSEKEGQEYIELIEAMEVANAVHDEEMQKHEDPVYERSLQLKKTNINDLEKLLADSLKKAKYSKLSLEKPEIGQYVVVPFTVQDNDSSRRDKVSVSELERLLKDALGDTNWRLLSNSVSYRLGYLEGRLKGHEREEDMLKLAGKKKEPIKPKSKISDEKRQKHASNNLVQLARLMGEMDGIENIRKRRLKIEPDGFFLEASEGPYSCGICGESHYGNEIWWNLDGLRCADCRRNITKGVIPPFKRSKYDNKAEWFDKWEITSNRGVHPSSVRKLRREGLLKGIDLKRKGGNEYFTLYLVSENQEFLKNYPKQGSKIKATIRDSKGNKVKL